MLHIPMKWLAIHQMVDETQIVLIDAAATGDEPARFESGRYAVIVLAKRDDGAIDLHQTPIISDYDAARKAFNEIRNA